VQVCTQPVPEIQLHSESFWHPACVAPRQRGTQACFPAFHWHRRSFWQVAVVEYRQMGSHWFSLLTHSHPRCCWHLAEVVMGVQMGTHGLTPLAPFQVQCGLALQAVCEVVVIHSGKHFFNFWLHMQFPDLHLACGWLIQISTSHCFCLGSH